MQKILWVKTLIRQKKLDLVHAMQCYAGEALGADSSLSDLTEGSWIQ